MYVGYLCRNIHINFRLNNTKYHYSVVLGPCTSHPLGTCTLTLSRCGSFGLFWASPWSRPRALPPSGGHRGQLNTPFLSNGFCSILQVKDLLTCQWAWCWDKGEYDSVLVLGKLSVEGGGKRWGGWKSINSFVYSFNKYSLSPYWGPSARVKKIDDKGAYLPGTQILVYVKYTKSKRNKTGNEVENDYSGWPSREQSENNSGAEF